MENLYRIHDNVLLSLEYNTRTIRPVYKYAKDNIIQYVDKIEEELSSTVWYKDYLNIGKKLNRYWSQNNYLVDISNFEEVTTYKQIEAQLLLKQGFDWDNIFGILFVLKDRNSNVIYKSRIFVTTDFQINYNNQQINGTFWSNSIKFWIPDILLIEQSTSFDVEIIDFDSIHSDNTILNYPQTFEALIPDMPLSDKVSINLNWNDKLQLEIEPVSLIPEYNVEQILMWNFSVNEIQNISVQHLIKYLADTDGNYSEILISNNINQLNKVILGLPLIYTDKPQLIEVTTFFRVNGLLATRYNTIIWNHFETMQNLLEQYIATKNDNIVVNPVNVIEEINIENKIIDTIKDTKLAQIITPVFTEIISDKQIISDNKNISFKEVKQTSYIKVYFDSEDESSEKNVYILSKITNENIIYFDLGEVNTLIREGGIKSVPFKLFDYVTGKLILAGDIVNK